MKRLRLLLGVTLLVLACAVRAGEVTVFAAASRKVNTVSAGHSTSL